MEIKRTLFIGQIPVFEINGLPFIRVGQVTYVTLRPIAENVRSKKQALGKVEEFEKKFGFPATLVTENEWDEVVQFCKTNFCTQDFIQLNKLDCNSVANTTDTNSEGIIFRAGPRHTISEKRMTWWSGDDCDGELQSPKSVFATVRLVD